MKKYWFVIFLLLFELCSGSQAAQDGFADQFGGPAQKKFLAKNFRKLLLDI